MMAIVVQVFPEFGLSVSKQNTDTLMTRVPMNQQKPPTPRPPRPPPVVIRVASQQYAQPGEFRYLGGLVTEIGDLQSKINCLREAARLCVKKFPHGRLDRMNAPCRLKVRLWKSEEGMEALLYGCMALAPRRDHLRMPTLNPPSTSPTYGLLGTIGYIRGSYRPLSYAHAL